MTILKELAARLEKQLSAKGKTLELTADEATFLKDTLLLDVIFEYASHPSDRKLLVSILTKLGAKLG